MNRQFSKEFRAILLPLSIALMLAVIMPLARFLVARDVVEGGSFVNFMSQVAGFAFYSALLAIAAIPFGMEFQYRTMPLLLTQPIARSLIWKHKLTVALMGIGLVVLTLSLCGFPSSVAVSAAVTRANVSSLHGGATNDPASGMSREQAETYARRYGLNTSGTERPSVRLNPAAQDMLPVREITIATLALLLPTLGSVTFWTLLARSTLGGMVFTVFSQLLYFGFLAFIAERGLGLKNAGGTPLFVFFGAIYGAIFFLVSWRKFSRLQMTQLLPGTLAGSKSLAGQGPSLAWLRCNSTSGFLNLIRKEIQLQRPLFLIAAILSVLWVVVYASLLLQPERRTFPEIICAVTIGFYLPLMSLLAGCISLGEEKNLGINAWQLTFPISAGRQWIIKLFVSLGAWLILGVLLPFGLTSLGGAISHLQFYKELELETWLNLGLLLTGVFAFGFWAMTLSRNTVRAVIGGIAIVVALCSVAALGYWIMIKRVLPHTLLQTILVYDVYISHWQGLTVSIVVGASTVLLGLLQSFVQFRQLQTSPKAIFKNSIGLVVFIFLGTICYFILLPISKYPTVIYFLLFVLMLVFLRQKAIPRQRGVGS